MGRTCKYLICYCRPVAKPDIIRKLRNGLYDVTASYQMEAESDEHTFECELTIPGTNYTVRKVLFVTPGESTFQFHQSVYRCATGP